MRAAFCDALVAAAKRPDFVFLTGDLGFKALEPLREAMGPRFINAGVAEQNMVSVAAGLAQTGLRPWVYSIAPFVYARAFEQIRNDVCLHNLPVVIVGNGGGYGYGVMGATHHALEDFGVLTSLPHLRAYLPAFDGDVADVVALAFAADHPCYLRLGLGEPPKGVSCPKYSGWRKVLEGSAGVLLAVGPLAGPAWALASAAPADRRPAIWVLSELPTNELPAEFLGDVRRCQRLLVAEEHTVRSGAGESVARMLLEAGTAPRWFRVAGAHGYPSGRYGSQAFHRRESGLDAETLLRTLMTAE